MRGEIALWTGIPAVVLAISIAVFRIVADRLQSNSPSRTTEDRLDELERLKRRDMVTPEEYTAKRQEILKDL